MAAHEQSTLEPGKVLPVGNDGGVSLFMFVIRPTGGLLGKKVVFLKNLGSFLDKIVVDFVLEVDLVGFLSLVVQSFLLFCWWSGGSEEVLELLAVSVEDLVWPLLGVSGQGGERPWSRSKRQPRGC